MTIDKDKTYKTQDGREVRIYSVDGSYIFCVHGAFNGPHGWVAAQWTAHGFSEIGKSGLPLDLIEVKPRIKQTLHVNLFVKPGGDIFSERYAAKVDADRFAEGRDAYVKIEIDVPFGEGLDNE
ncbi:MAG: hypothetical protein JKY81_01695 [Colwellia sp.]|nr:hypothetical protein [Colwellia sp.]